MRSKRAETACQIQAELTEKATIRDFRIVQIEGAQQVERSVKH